MSDALFSGIAYFSPSVPPDLKTLWTQHGGTAARSAHEKQCATYYFCDGMGDPWLPELRRGGARVVFDARWVRAAVDGGYRVAAAAYVLDGRFAARQNAPGPDGASRRRRGGGGERGRGVPRIDLRRVKGKGSVPETRVLELGSRDAGSGRASPSLPADIWTTLSRDAGQTQAQALSGPGDVSVVIPIDKLLESLSETAKPELQIFRPGLVHEGRVFACAEKGRVLRGSSTSVPKISSRLP